MVEKTLKNIGSVIKELIKILKWKEIWIPTIVSLGIVGTWFFFAWVFTISFPVRAVIMWGLIIGLSILAPER